MDLWTLYSAAIWIGVPCAALWCALRYGEGRLWRRATVLIRYDDAPEVFAVVLARPNEGVRNRLRKTYADAYELSDTVMLIRAESGERAEGIASAGGIFGNHDRAAGVVLKLQEDYYSGFTAKTLWDWLQKPAVTPT